MIQDPWFPLQCALDTTLEGNQEKGRKREGALKRTPSLVLLDDFICLDDGSEECP